VASQLFRLGPRIKEEKKWLRRVSATDQFERFLTFSAAWQKSFGFPHKLCEAWRCSICPKMNKESRSPGLPQRIVLNFEAKIVHQWKKNKEEMRSD
jgi:hypothetical protein